MNVSDQAIPRSVLEKAVAIAVFPSTIKGAFLVGAQRGRGVISVRKPDGSVGAAGLPGPSREAASGCRSAGRPPTSCSS